MVPPDTTAQADDRLLPWRKVKDLTGLSRTTAWRRQKAGDFPIPVVISPGRVGWRESEVAAWQASRSPRSAAPPKATAEPRSWPVEREPVAPSADTAPPQPEPRLRRASRSRSAPVGAPSQMSFNF